MQLDWNNDSGGPIFQPKDKNMGEFTFDHFTYEKRISDYNITDNFDNLVITFQFSRNVYYFIWNMYTPCIMIVTLSWVSFWINYRSIPARVSLGITAVLTMGTLGNNIRKATPTVSHTKLIDYYVILCFFYVFAALIEFAFVGVTDLHWKKYERKRSSLYKGGNCGILKSSYRNNGYSDAEESGVENGDGRRCDGNNNANVKRRGVIFAPDTDVLNESYHDVLKRKQKKGTIKKTTQAVVKKFFKKHEKNEDIHFIDKWSRVAFPLSFLLANILYFVICLRRE